VHKQTITSFSFTGEDFDIFDVTEGKINDFARVRGAMMHLPGKDKMNIYSSSTGEKSVIMDRVMIAATPSYNLIRASDGTKIGWMEKKLISFTDSFDVYMEGKGGFGITGLFKPTPAYRIEGDFFDRNFVFKNEKGAIVARANVDGKFAFCMAGIRSPYIFRSHVRSRFDTIGHDESLSDSGWRGYGCATSACLCMLH
jgi:hypothetical protein